MIRYFFLGSFYKIFSSNNFTIKLYRMLGNTIGAKRRINSGLSQKHVDLGNELISLLNDYCRIKNGDNLLELGTGWVHWFAIYIKLFADVKVTLFDIWDNRQFGPLKSHISQLSNQLKFKEDSYKFKNEKIINSILNANTFEDLYKLLNFKYIIQRDGSLKNFPDNNFNGIFSVNVFEHIEKRIIKEYINDIYRIIKPGGFSVQMIDIGDHYHYLLNKKHSCIKEYLKFSNKRWDFFYENKIQYINRIQFSEWRKLFKDAGFKEVYCNPNFEDINVRVHTDYNELNENDINCYKLTILHCKE